MTEPDRGNALVDEAYAAHRRELHVHCYRMLASYDEAEDAVQETYLRAWRYRDTFEGENVRAWLYKIATNVCLDDLRKRGRQPVRSADVPWLSLYPDNLLDEVAPREGEPDAVVVSRETVELAFLVALQVLPPRQRAALLAREVLAMSAKETADLLGISVAAANSALQRARATMQEHVPSHRNDWRAHEPSAEERQLLARFIDAHERCDAVAALAAASEDLRVTMPPLPFSFESRAELAVLLARTFGEERDGDWRLVPTAANRMPAAASYLRRYGDTKFRAFKFDLLRIEGAEITEITTFGPQMFGLCGLPEILPD